MDSLIFAARSNIRNAVVGGLLTLGLVACGGGSGSSSSGAAAASAPSLVSPSAGFIDRSGSTTTAGNTSQPPVASTPVTTPAPTSSPAPVTNPPPVASAGVASLDWTPPTQNSDGSALSDLAGYTVYYGTAPGSLTQSIQVANPGLASFTVSNLAAGTWYFSVTAYSSSGNESTRSAIVNVTI